jgi:hypothetical protein
MQWHVWMNLMEFIRHKFHMNCYGIEAGTSRWQAGYWPRLRSGYVTYPVWIYVFMLVRVMWHVGV